MKRMNEICNEKTFTTQLCFVFFVLGLLPIYSCEKFLAIDPPQNSLVDATVFKTDGQAIAALTGIYATMASVNSYASGGSSSITFYAGMSSDELTGYGTYIPIYENQLFAEFNGWANPYSGLYKSIYAANAVIEGLASSNSLTPATKTLLEGEALFIRAFNHFYLVNLYGEVPLHLTTDYRVTSTASKSSIPLVYERILEDLKLAEVLLSDTYPTIGRTRPNKQAVQALLARTYLYLKDWQNAEIYASLVIEKSNVYSLVELNEIFLADSKEAIWQLMPPTNLSAGDGDLFIPGNLTVAPTTVSLSSTFIANLFDVNDKRNEAWIKSYSTTSGTFYYPFKYKRRNSVTGEYSTVFRLAEQYLIRSESRIYLDKLDLGIADLNIVRNRPLANVGNSNPVAPISTNLNKQDALLAVERERKSELFTEWGHRWLDLKRTGKANSILDTLKSQWQPTDVLYPIPIDEINRNSNISQNSGY